MVQFEEFKKQWGVNGMPADKIRLATAAFKAGTIAAAEIAETHTCSAGVNRAIAFDIRASTGLLAP